MPKLKIMQQWYEKMLTAAIYLFLETSFPHSMKQNIVPSIGNIFAAFHIHPLERMEHKLEASARGLLPQMLQSDSSLCMQIDCLQFALHLQPRAHF